MSLVHAAAAPIRMTPPPPPPVSSAEVVGTLRSHLGRIAVIAGVFVAISILFVLFSTPQFTVSGSLYLGDAQNHGTSIPTAYDGLGMPTTFQSVSDVDTQIDLLDSQSLIEQAILESGLNSPVHPTGYSTPNYIGWLLFGDHRVGAFAPMPGALRAQFATYNRPDAGTQNFRVTLGDNGAYTISRLGLFSNALVLKGHLGQPAGGGGLNLILKPALVDAPPAAGDTFTLTVKSAETVADSIIGSRALQIAPGGTLASPTKVVALSLLGHDPYSARLFIDQLMNDFIGTQIAWKTRSATDTEDYIAQQITTVKKSLADADQQLSNYQAQTGILDVPENAKAIITQLSEYEIQRTNAALAEQALQKLEAEISHPKGGLDQYLVSQTSDPVLVQLATNLANAEVQLQTLDVQYTGNTTQVQGQEATIAKLKDSIRSVVGNDLSLATSNVTKMDTMIAQYNAQLKSMPQESLQVIALTRSAEVYGQLYTMLMQKSEEADVSKASTVIDTRIASLAEVPLQPSSPRPILTVFGGAVMGILAGLAFAFGKRATSGRLQSEEEVTRLAPLPVFGMLPPHFRRKPEAGVFMDRSQDPFTESMRFVRDNIYQAHPGGECCVLLITSATSGDGKTEVALNLARSLADDGKKAILVDADLRRSPENKSFKTSPAEGGPDALKTIANMALQTTGSTGLADWVATSRTPSFEKYPKQDFYMLPAGPMPLNPVELMNRPRFSEALETLRQEFEYVIIDSPPLPAVADGLRLAKQADIVLSVVRPCHTGRQTFITHNEMLGRLGRQRGLILNDIVRTSYGYGYGDGFESQFRAGKTKKSKVKYFAEKLWRAVIK